MKLHDLTATLINDTETGALQRVVALWNAVYCSELGWINDSSPVALSADPYHGVSEYWLLTARSDDGAFVDLGTLRCVIGTCHALPVERHINLASLRARGPIMEVQRLMVLSCYRSQPFPNAPFGLLALLIRSLTESIVMRGYRTVVVNAFDDSRRSPVNMFKTLGFRRIGQQFHDQELACTTPSVVMALDVPRALGRGLALEAHPFVDYFLANLRISLATDQKKARSQP